MSLEWWRLDSQKETSVFFMVCLELVPCLHQLMSEGRWNDPESASAADARRPV